MCFPNGKNTMKKLEDYEWICPEPFANLMTTTDSHYIPCCALDYNALYKKHYDELSSTKKHTIKEYYESEFLNKFRDAIKNNDREFLKDICKNCISTEKSGNRSHRQYYLSRYVRGDFKNKKKELEKVISNNSVPNFLHSVEALSIGGNICNLSCNMCGSGCSSKYNSEAYKLHEEKFMLPMSSNYGKFIEDLNKFDILEMKFTGGEPLLIKKNYEVMSQLSKKTLVRIITNGTVNPSRLINILKDYRVDIMVSVEGTKDVTEYIRYGSDFNIVLKHFDMMQKVWGDSVMFTTTINALNITSIPDLLNIRKGHAGSPVTNNFYSLNSIPYDIREKYLNKLYETGQTDLIKYLENAEYNETDMWKMLRHIKRRDRLRGTNLLDVFPEWKEYYETCNG